MRGESEQERRARHWLAERSFYAECMSTRDGVVRVRDVVHDLWDCHDVMEPELCRRLGCRPFATYASGARRVLDAHLVLLSPRDGDEERLLEEAEPHVSGRAELPAQL